MYQAKEYRHVKCLVWGFLILRALACRQRVRDNARTVAHFKTDTGWNYRIIAIVIAPVRHVGYTCTKTTLIQAVGIAFSLERSLRVAVAHNDKQKDFNGRLCHEPISLPTVSALACVGAEGCCTDSRCSHSQHRSLRRVKCRAFCGAVKRQSGTVAASIPLAVADY